MREGTCKACTKCGVVQPLDEFGRSKRTRDGHKSQCRTCKRAESARYRAANPEKIRAYSAARSEERKLYQAQWYAANRERVRAMQAAWHVAHPEWRAEYYAAHKDEIAANLAEWRAANPGAVLANNARDRGVAIVEKFTIDELRTHLLARGIDPDICVYCKEKPRQHWDHVLPIALGGSHTMENLAPACASCNHRKSKKPPGQ